LRFEPILHRANFLERIVTADETWLHHYEPESKAQECGLETPDIIRG
jgi:hypothetical protein